MNRPKLEEYWNDGAFDHVNDYLDYLEGIEKYCDELEQEIKNLNNFSDEREVETTSMFEVYGRALDKACEKLAFASNEHIIEELGSFTLGEINRTKEQWKDSVISEYEDEWGVVIKR